MKLAGDDGHAAWAKTYTGPSTCAGFLQAVTMSRDGLVWATGQVGASCSFGGRAAPAATGAQGALIASFTPSGDSQGLWTIAGGNAAAVAASPDGAIYVGGWVGGVTSTDFDPGSGVVTRTLPPGDGDPTGFVLRLGADAAFAWVDTSAHVEVLSLATTADSGVIVLGQPVPDTEATTAFVLRELTADQASPWSLSFPGTNTGPFNVSASPTRFVVSGATYGAMDLDPSAAIDSFPADESFVSRYSF